MGLGLVCAACVRLVKPVREGRSLWGFQKSTTFGWLCARAAALR